MRRFVTACCALAIATGASILGPLGPAPAGADTITRATVTVDARDPASPALEMNLTWTAQGGPPRSALRLYVANAVEITGAEADGTRLRVAPADVVVEGGALAAWDVFLPLPLPSGVSRTFSLSASIDPADPGEGIRIARDGGALLPGAGWFPRTRPDAASYLACSVNFDLPEGRTGISVGTPAGPAGPWTTQSAVRPFAVWGVFDKVAIDGDPGIVAYRQPGVAGDVPRVDRIREILAALEAGLGPAVGGGDWTLVDLGEGPARGAARTLFWDEGEAAAADGEHAEIVERDIAGALAISFWTECLRFRGEYAAWLDGGFPLSLGDIVRAALDPNEDRTPIEHRLIGSRRGALIERLPDDRALRGLDPFSADSRRVLEGRGALAVHAMSLGFTARSDWMIFLREFRVARDGTDVEWADLLTAADDRLKNQFSHLPGLVDGTDLPDFRISDHGQAEGRHKSRYRVELENTGTLDCPVEVAIFTPGGQRIRSLKVTVAAGLKRAILFRSATRIGRIEIDPSGLVPQSSIEGEVVRLGPDPVAAEIVEERIIPSYRLSTRHDDTAEVKGLAIDLAPGMRIEEFDGHIQWHSTHHGPSGASLMGNGRVILEPTGALGEALQEDRGREIMTFEANEMWIRFPLGKWDEILPLLGDRVNSRVEGVEFRNQRIHQFSFPTHFYDEGRAQIPPPGAGPVTFGLPGDQRRGLVRLVNPDGTVTMRFWDHRRGSTIWEATR